MSAREPQVHGDANEKSGWFYEFSEFMANVFGLVVVTTVILGLIWGLLTSEDQRQRQLKGLSRTLGMSPGMCLELVVFIVIAAGFLAHLPRNRTSAYIKVVCYCSITVEVVKALNDTHAGVSTMIVACIGAIIAISREFRELFAKEIKS